MGAEFDLRTESQKSTLATRVEARKMNHASTRRTVATRCVKYTGKYLKGKEERRREREERERYGFR